VDQKNASLLLMKGVRGNREVGRIPIIRRNQASLRRAGEEGRKGPTSDQISTPYLSHTKKSTTTFWVYRTNSITAHGSLNPGGERGASRKGPLPDSTMALGREKLKRPDTFGPLLQDH